MLSFPSHSFLWDLTDVIFLQHTTANDDDDDDYEWHRKQNTFVLTFDMTSGSHNTHDDDITKSREQHKIWKK